MSIVLKHALKNIRSFLKHNPDFVFADAKLARFLSPCSEVPLLPSSMGKASLERFPHSQEFLSMNSLFADYQEYSMVLDFVLSNFFLYQEFSGVEVGDESSVLLGLYADELDIVNRKMTQLRAQASAYRRTFSAQYLTVEKHYPSTKLPLSKPSIAQLCFHAGIA